MSTALLAPVTLVSALLGACGDERPPAAEGSTGHPTGSGGGGTSSGDGGGVIGIEVLGYSTMCRAADGGVSTVTVNDPEIDCRCTKVPLGAYDVTMPCGFAVCSVGFDQTVVCGYDGVVTHYPTCPLATGIPEGWMRPCSDFGPPDQVDGGVDAAANERDGG
ncbi:MAG: hypothetical protein JWP97_117 [Labilithrix sp.]|nr:hypothetical protein [Labilithrix sp.]